MRTVSGKSNNITDKAVRQIVDTLASTGIISVREVEIEPILAGMRPDVIINIASGKKSYKVIIEVKSRGEPLYLREAAFQINKLIKSGIADYGIIAAPYISQRGFDICRELSVGCIDSSGNIYFSFAEVYIEKSGYPNINIRERLSTDIFTPKSSRVLRVLLNNPSRSWNGSEMAAETDLSMGQVSNVRKALRENEYIAEDKRRFEAVRPGELLDEWADSYNSSGNELFYYHSLDRLGTLEKKIAKLFERNNINYAFSLFAGADKIAPYADYFQVHLYAEDIPENALLANDIERIPKEANLVIMMPYDEGVFYGKQTVGAYKIVSNIQLYLDLYSRGGRARDAARYLFENAIRIDWGK